MLDRSILTVVEGSTRPLMEPKMLRNAREHAVKNIAS